jgi:ubiquinone/menaquinone biosynthesis C-methylase UbiE
VRSGSHTLTALQLLAIFNVLKDVGGKVNLIDLRSSLLEVLREKSAQKKRKKIKVLKDAR